MRSGALRCGVLRCGAVHMGSDLVRQEEIEYHVNHKNEINTPVEKEERVNLRVPPEHANFIRRDGGCEEEGAERHEVPALHELRAGVKQPAVHFLESILKPDDVLPHALMVEATDVSPGHERRHEVAHHQLLVGVLLIVAGENMHRCAT